LTTASFIGHRSVQPSCQAKTWPRGCACADIAAWFVSASSSFVAPSLTPEAIRLANREAPGATRGAGTVNSPRLDGSAIGTASADIAAGAHVHTHNVASGRGRGDLDTTVASGEARLAEPTDDGAARNGAEPGPAGARTSISSESTP